MIKKAFRLPFRDANAGVYYLPSQEAQNLPVLVYCHGWGGDYQLAPVVKAFADTVVPKGLAVVSFSFYACGDTGGDSSQTSYGRWTSNLRDILKWTRQQPWADSSRIGCWGISSGTNPCMRVASEENHPAFVISTATFITYLGYSMRTFAEHFELLIKGGTAETLGIQAPLSFYMDMIGNAPVHRLDKIRCPVLFLTGEEDNAFRKADALIGYEQMKRSGLPARHLLIPKGDHGLDNVAETGAVEAMKWLKEIDFF